MLWRLFCAQGAKEDANARERPAGPISGLFHGGSLEITRAAEKKVDHYTLARGDF